MSDALDLGQAVDLTNLLDKSGRRKGNTITKTIRVSHPLRYSRNGKRVRKRGLLRQTKLSVLKKR